MPPCCSADDPRIPFGSFCRCCGEPMVQNGNGYLCHRPTHGLHEACRFCGRDSCGFHAVTVMTGDGAAPARRYCEMCGTGCSASGSCPEHALQQSTSIFDLRKGHRP